MAINAVKKELLAARAYAVGDRDERAWGAYEVTDVGGEGLDAYCEKTLYIKPRKALSLQKHSLRKEPGIPRWRSVLA